jgi:CRISPR/Cas system-associated exonuclease Cas4 (RecB family)
MHTNLEGLDDFISNQFDLDGLLSKYKVQKGFNEDKTTFLGINDIASYYWCSREAVFKAKENEIKYFKNAIIDSFIVLNLIDDFKLDDLIALKPLKILSIANNIKTNELYNLFFENEEGNDSPKNRRLGYALYKSDSSNPYREAMIYFGSYNKERKKDDSYICFVDTVEKFLSLDKKYQEELVKTKHRDTRSLDEIENGKPFWTKRSYAKSRGKLLHELNNFKNKYKTFRWHFSWNNYIITGVPDGIKDNFVYEYKSANDKYYYNNYIKLIANSQADLYGYFFKKREKKVETVFIKEGKLKEIRGKVDIDSALDLLHIFKNTLEGNLEHIAPVKWKCKKCDYYEKCEVTSLKKT